MKSKIAVSLLVIALAAALMGGATFAYFTSEAENTGNVFSTGTLQISITDPVEEAIFNVGNMYPGQPAVTDYIYVKNDGTLPMKFWGKVEGNDNNDNVDLADKLNVTITLKGVNSGQGFDTRNQLIYNGTLADLIAQSAHAATSPLQWAPSESNQWAFGAGWEAKYEIAIEFDPSAGNDYQNTSFDGKLTFYATQWNNPGWGETVAD